MEDLIEGMTRLRSQQDGANTAHVFWDEARRSCVTLLTWNVCFFFFLACALHVWGEGAGVCTYWWELEHVEIGGGGQVIDRGEPGWSGTQFTTGKCPC